MTCVVTPTLASTTMTVLNYTLPPPIFLPSSGGYTSSRFVEDPLHNRVFPFRKYDVDEDGRLVYRTRSANREHRPRPYDRPQRPSGRSTSPSPELNAAPRDLSTPSKQVDPSIFSQLFSRLVPIAVNEPLAFESKASTICASFNLDPATSADIMNSIKQQLPAVRNQETIVSPASGGLTNLESTANRATSVAPTPPSMSVNPPSTSLLPNASPETPVVPIKQRRQFSCGSPAYTTWYSTASAENLACPPPDVTPAAGELYIHHNRLEDRHQIWLYGLDSVWKCVTGVEKVYHPTIDDRVLSMRANGTPNWITSASYTTIRGRKGKKTQSD